MGEMLLAPYRLRILNREVAVLCKREIVDRFTGMVGGVDRYYQIHEALRMGDVVSLDGALNAAVNESTSFYGPIPENSAHMLMTGLLYGMPGYLAPRSNGKVGGGGLTCSCVLTPRFAFIRRTRARFSPSNVNSRKAARPLMSSSA